jgi:two-component system nitrate/nitrite response regulator NarL
MGGGSLDGQAHGNRIRLLLLSNQALLRASLGRFLTCEQAVEVVTECGDSRDALEALAVSSVDLVLLDCDDNSGTWEHFILAARARDFQGSFLAITGTAGPGFASHAIRLGVAGVFLKSDPPDRLLQAIQLVASGAVWLDQQTLRALVDQSVEPLPSGNGRAAGDVLTDREQRVLRGILGGLTNRKIGEKIGLSEASVKTSVQQLFMRAGVHRRSQLVRAALEGSLGSRELATAGPLDGTAGRTINRLISVDS